MTREPMREPRRHATRTAPHVRDALDVPAALRRVLLAALPCAALGVANAGHQALAAARDLGLPGPPGWRGAALSALGVGASPESAAACAAHGLALLLPALAVAAAVGFAWTQLFARARGRDASDAFPLVVALFVAMLPPGVPLWQVALGASFAVAVGLEIFGGTGRNVVHPSLAGLAFLYFAYPASFSGEGSWTGVPGAALAPVLTTASQGGLEAVRASGVAWRDTLLGREPGAFAETSALACALGGALLLWLRLAPWRVLLGGVLGLVAAAQLAGALGDSSRPMADFPWYWHLTTGSFAFGLVFLATDPVTSPATPTGRLAYGLGIGILVGVIRIFNPAHPEGTVMAILLGNVVAPLLDHAAVALQQGRRARRVRRAERARREALRG